MRHRWTQKELDLLEEHYATRGAKWCAKHLRRSRQSVAHKARRMGLTNRSRRSSWTPEEDAILEANFRTMPWRKLVERLGRCRDEVFVRAARLGFRHRFPDHWTADEAAPVLGVDPSTVCDWVARGWISAKKIDGAWRISTAALRRFVYHHPHRLSPDKVDWLSFVDLCIGREK